MFDCLIHLNGFLPVLCNRLQDVAFISVSFRDLAHLRSLCAADASTSAALISNHHMPNVRVFDFHSRFPGSFLRGGKKKPPKKDVESASFLYANKATRLR